MTVSGSGCPSGTTASVFARIEGASDDPVPAFDPANPGVPLELGSGGSFSEQFTVPAASPEGENRVWVYCVSEGGEPMAGRSSVCSSLTTVSHLPVHRSSR